MQKIFGPGNAYVVAAKRLLFGYVAVDLLPGPSEVLVLADDTANPRFIAADLLAQAEHDVDACAILLTTSKRLAKAVAAQIEKQLETLPTAAVARKAIARNSAIVLTGSLNEAIDISNRFAPEHLSIGDESLLARVTHAGSVRTLLFVCEVVSTRVVWILGRFYRQGAGMRGSPRSTIAAGGL